MEKSVVKKDGINPKAVVCLVLGILSFVVLFFLPVELYVEGIIVGFIIALAGIVFNVLAKKELKQLKDEGKGKGKGQATAGLVLSIISLVVAGMNILAVIMLNNVELASVAYCPVENNMINNCVVNEDGVTATCKYMDMLDAQCKVEVLDSSQFATKSE